MLSTCPSCLSQVNHADHLFDVACECGNHFSPFLNVEASGGYDIPAEASGGGSGGGAGGEMALAPEYNESVTAFQEIVNFGETLNDDNVDKPLEPLSSQEPESVVKEPPRNTKAAAPQPVSTGGAVIMISGHMLSDYQITEYLSPISTLTDLDVNSDNPMQNAFETIRATAESLGATAVIGLMVTALSGGTKILLMGTPVRCVKLN